MTTWQRDAMLERMWYGLHPGRWLLYPFACVYRFVTMLRRVYLRLCRQYDCPVPLIVVGNLTVGGVGKTPLVAALAQHFQARGFRVGIVSRGYGATTTCFPHEVSINDSADEVGDEPLLLAQKTQAPIVIAPKRVDAVKYLLTHHHSQIILSDDGLQHYAMGRAIEIVVIDGQRALGNQLCLPAGPLREAPSRLNTVDFVVVNTGHQKNAYTMRLAPGKMTSLMTNQTLLPSDLPSPVAAMAGIGHPQRFFDTLDTLHMTYNPYIFPDHHRFKISDIPVREKTVVMTEKDAVKCRAFATNTMYYLPVSAVLDDAFWHALWAHPRLKGYVPNRLENTSPLCHSYDGENPS